MPIYNVVLRQEFDPDVKAMSPDAEQFVAQALPTLGWVQRTCGHWTHGLQVRCFFSLFFFGFVCFCLHIVFIFQWWVMTPFYDTLIMKKQWKKGAYRTYMLAKERNAKRNWEKKKREKKWASMLLSVQWEERLKCLWNVRILIGSVPQWYMAEPFLGTWFQKKLAMRVQGRAYRLAKERNSKYNWSIKKDEKRLKLCMEV